MNTSEVIASLIFTQRVEVFSTSLAVLWPGGVHGLVLTSDQGKATQVFDARVHHDSIDGAGRRLHFGETERVRRGSQRARES